MEAEIFTSLLLPAPFVAIRKMLYHVNGSRSSNVRLFPLNFETPLHSLRPSEVFEQNVIVNVWSRPPSYPGCQEKKRDADVVTSSLILTSSGGSGTSGGIKTNQLGVFFFGGGGQAMAGRKQVKYRIVSYRTK